ncbi:MAG: hypothetical protein ACKO6F_08890 [Cyanobium sp.]
MSDEDILNPSRLIFNRVVPFVDSFDGAPVGTIFVTKRSILGHPEMGVIGEKGSESYRQNCLFFCPMGTSDIDASYVYVIQKKGECTIGVRGIGWAEKEEEHRGGLFTGYTVEKGRVRYTSKPLNILAIQVNDIRVGPPLNKDQLTGPHGTNYKYFPRKKNYLGTQTTANEGYITDIHFFSARELVLAANQGQPVIIDMPAWQPGRHVIGGNELNELRKLTARCELD